MTVNWMLVGVLALTVAGGVGIGLITAPRGRNRRTFVVVRSWFDPQGLEILYESRSLKSAKAWHNRHRLDCGDEAKVLYVYDRDRVDGYNAEAMASPKFWVTINALTQAAMRLEEAEGTMQALYAEMERLRVEKTLSGPDPMFTVDLKQTVTDTAGMILDEIRRLTEQQAFPLPEVGSVMPQMDPTEAMSVDSVVAAALSAEADATAKRLAAIPPAGLPSVTLPKIPKAPQSKTVVLKFGHDNRLQ